MRCPPRYLKIASSIRDTTVAHVRRDERKVALHESTKYVKFKCIFSSDSYRQILVIYVYPLTQILSMHYRYTNIAFKLMNAIQISSLSFRVCIYLFNYSFAATFHDK